MKRLIILALCATAFAQSNQGTARLTIRINIVQVVQPNPQRPITNGAITLPAHTNVQSSQQTSTYQGKPLVTTTYVVK